MLIVFCICWSINVSSVKRHRLATTKQCHEQEKIHIWSHPRTDFFLIWFAEIYQNFSMECGWFVAKQGALFLNRSARFFWSETKRFSSEKFFPGIYYLRRFSCAPCTPLVWSNLLFCYKTPATEKCSEIPPPCNCW